MRAGAYPVWRLLREARLAAGLTQRNLSERAATTQSAVARYETARALPDIDTLQRLLTACGRRLEFTAVAIDERDLRRSRESLAMTPRQLVERNRRITRLAEKAARARREGRVRPLVL